MEMLRPKPAKIKFHTMKFSCPVRRVAPMNAKISLNFELYMCRIANCTCVSAKTGSYIYDAVWRSIGN